MRSFPILDELGLMIMTAAVLLLVGRPLRVPSILTYMIAGIILGPLTGLVGGEESLAVFSELGIALLLFLVGLELSLARIKDVGGVALSVGLMQVALSTLLGAGLAILLGFPTGDALVLGLALAFSSTVVVVKLLDRSGGVATPHGRMTIGILLVQDLVVALALTVMTGLGGGGEQGLPTLVSGLLRSVLGMVALGAAAAGGVRWILPRLLAWIAASAETLFVVSLTWCFLFILGSEAFGISIELGAFVAGLALAQLPYAAELERRVHPLVEFFLAVFFVSLSAGIDLQAALALWPEALVLSLFVLVAKPAIVAGLLARGGGSRATAVLTGLTLGQVSEFGFVLVAIALGAGLTDNEALAALMGLAGIITIGISSALVPLAPRIVRRLEPMLGSSESEPEESAGTPTLTGHILVVGMNTLGRLVVERLAARGEQVVAMDLDPACLEGLPAVTVFGSADSPTVLERAGLARAKLVVAAPRIEEANALLAHRCRRLAIPISVHAFDPSLTDELIEMGVDHVMVSKEDGIGLIEVELRRLGVTA